MAIEMATAAALPIGPDSLRGYALDSRMFHDEVVFRTPPTGVWPVSLAVPLAVPKSHGVEHLKNLAAHLNVAGVIDEASACKEPPSSACRAGSGSGTLAFGPAIMRDGLAQIVLYRFLKPTVANGRPIHRRVMYFVSLARSETAWRVTGVRVSHMP
jgi:hypothetical protein